MFSRANFRFWLQADIQSPKIDFRFTPVSRHSSVDVRFRAEFVRFTPECGLPGYGDTLLARQRN